MQPMGSSQGKKFKNRLTKMKTGGGNLSDGVLLKNEEATWEDVKIGGQLNFTQARKRNQTPLRADG